MASTNVVEVNQLATEEDFVSLIAKKEGSLTVVHFKSDWSEACKQMTTVLKLMKSDQEAYPGVEYAEIDAESVPTVSMKYKVSAVPTVLVFSNGKEIERVDGLRTARLTTFVRSHILNPRSTPLPEPVKQANTESAKEPLEDRLKKLVNKHDIMVFMKGNPTAPRCGFSNTLMGILKETELPFETFDILGDEEVRQGLKTFSNWQTYPQIYVKGELVGGLDIIKDLKDSGELLSTLKGEES